MHVPGLLFLFLSASINAQLLCASNKFCVFSEDSGTDVQVRIAVIASSVQWVSIGFGSSMKSAEVYVNLVN
jgi:hypothetical protein